MSPDTISVGSDVPVLDQRCLLDQFGDEPEIIAELHDLFVEDFPHQVDEIGEGLANGDSQKIARAAHSLKGASGTFGAERVFQVALSMEQLARDGKLEGVSIGFDLLKEELDKVVSAIHALQPEG